MAKEGEGGVEWELRGGLRGEFSSCFPPAADNEQLLTFSMKRKKYTKNGFAEEFSQAPSFVKNY